MKLPSTLLKTLYLASAVAACEPAHPTVSEPIEQAPVVDDTPLDEVVRNASQDDSPADLAPGAAPRWASPPPSAKPVPSPPPAPKIRPKAKPKQVWANVCGHMELVDSGMGLVKCGMG